MESRRITRFIVALLLLGIFIASLLKNSKIQLTYLAPGYSMAKPDVNNPVFDVLVFLHIQKTGGSTFGQHLVDNLDFREECSCPAKVKVNSCKCLSQRGYIWLFSRFSTGWPCGVHPGWTQLKHCVPTAMDKKERQHRPRRYLYITMLREPAARYLSEWNQVTNAGSWPLALWCNGRQPTAQELPICYKEKEWKGKSLTEFLNCKTNLANNRQVMMLADMSIVNCYNLSGISEESRNAKLLRSAKENLAEMMFFGLTEYQAETQYMLERTFNISVKRDFTPHKTRAESLNVTSEQLSLIKKLNQLDINLYYYAKEIFFKRLTQMKKQFSES